MLQVWRIGEPNTGFWRGNLRERDHLEDQGIDVSSGSGMGSND
jgi:hypothetical protein